MANLIFNIVKKETNVKGYWKDSEGKLYIDNIEPLSFDNEGQYQYYRDRLFKLGEKAVFVIFGQSARVIYREGASLTLKNRIAWDESQEPSQAYILELLKNAEGLTVYKKEGQGFTIEIWKA